MTDAQYMQRALTLAERGRGFTSPNPMVGAVVVHDDTIVGEGWHAGFGEAHAETVALAAAGAKAHGATLYVTLEPCHHTGKTPPCTQAILAAGIARVVYAVADPNPVAAGGAAALSAHGVSVLGGVCENEGRELVAAFCFAVERSDRPYVTLKLATSIDGAIAGASRTRHWLTGPESSVAVHGLRASVDAIAVGIGTVEADDPQLTVREGHRVRVVPPRVVFDRRARLSHASALVQTAHEVPVVVIADGSHSAAEQRLREVGVEVLQASGTAHALALLRARGVTHLLLEGGATMASAFLAAGFVDRLITFQAPVVLGAGALAAFATYQGHGEGPAPRFTPLSRRACGLDLMTTYAVSTD